MPVIPKYILVDSDDQLLKNIILDEKIFEKFITLSQISFTDRNGYRRDHRRAENKNLDSLYWKRKKILESFPTEILKEQKQIDSDELGLNSLKLKELLSKYDLEKCEAFTMIGLEPLMNVFIRRGYIDEEYYDYISYFYEGAVTQNDRDLLLAMKQAKQSDYTTKIDKVENFIKQLPLYVFNHDSVLNNGLVDYLIQYQEYYPDKYELLMTCIDKNYPPFDFIVQYYENGKQVDKLFERLIQSNRKNFWNTIIRHNNESERSLLIEGWLRFCKVTDLLKEQEDWLENNYEFLVEHLEAIGLDKAKSLSEGRKYIKLTPDSEDLLSYIVDNNSYALNRNNLSMLISYLDKMINVNKENLNLKRIKQTGNEKMVSYVKENLATIIKELSHTIKDEDNESILWILNDENINISDKKEYLREQSEHILDINQVGNDAKDIAVELFLIEPSWENIAKYFAFSENQINEHLTHFIENFAAELGSHVCEDTTSNHNQLFNELILSNITKFDAYKSILKSFRCHGITTDNESFAELEPARLELLIDSGMISFTKKNTNILSSMRASTFAKYLSYHKKDFLKEVDSVSYSAELALDLMKSTAFSTHEKALIIPMLSAKIISSKPELATAICFLLTLEEIDLAEDCLMAIIGNSYKTEDRITVVALTIENNPQNYALIEELLNQLPSPYKDIAVHDRKRPTLLPQNYNLHLLDILQNVGYISSYSDSEKGYKVNKKIS